MTPSRTQPSRPAGAPRGAGGRAVRSAAVTGDVSDGKAQATALARAGMPAYFPRVIASGSSYCSGLTGNCPVQIASPGSYPRAYVIHGESGGRYPAYRMTLVLNPALGEYYGVQGDDLAAPADPRAPNRNADRRRQAAAGLWQRRQADQRRMAHPAGGVLDLEYAHERPAERADDRDRRVADPGLMPETVEATPFSHRAAHLATSASYQRPAPPIRALTEVSDIDKCAIWRSATPAADPSGQHLRAEAEVVGW